MKKTALLTVAILISGCNSYQMSMGVTPGGSQDLNLARQIIYSGGIPFHYSFTAEGLFSEHDLPITASSCDDTLCPQTAMAQITNHNEEQHLLAQLGFSTNITADSFQRRPLNISAAVDISGSMTGEKLEMTKEALLLMVEQLNEQDHMSLVTYGSFARVRKRTLQMNDYGKWAMTRSIQSLRTGGSTNMESGMLQAYDLLEDQMNEDGVENRLMLFTDAQPNIGATGTNSFLGITREYAEKGIGLSVFGVGLDLGAELANEISKTRGGNSYFLSDKEYVQQVFAEEFDFVVSPIAYNLEVTLNLDEEISLEQVLGAPNDSESSAFSFGASTLFLSARNGGIGVLLQAENISEKLGALDIQYETLAGEIKEDTTHLQYLGGGLVSSSVNADDLGVFTMANLIHELNALKAGADFCEGIMEQEEALLTIAYAKTQLREIAEQLDASEFLENAELMVHLYENVSLGEEACSQESHYLP